MSIKSILLALVAGDGAKPQGAIDYAISLAATNGAHCRLVAYGRPPTTGNHNCAAVFNQLDERKQPVRHAITSR